MDPSLYPVIAWLVLAVVLAVVEAVTVGLVSVWFAVGALAAMVPAYLGWPLWTQFVVFLAVAALCFAFTRPFFKNVLQIRKESTNADRLIGQNAVVSEAIDNLHGQGRVEIEGLTWAARTQDGSPAEAGSVVTVQGIRGVTLVVLPAQASPRAAEENEASS